MARVLIVEPSRPLAQTYGAALEAAGHDVLMCTTAQQAVLAADDMKPEVVVLELQLVGHSGLEFLYEFRSYADWQHTPVIIHSMVPPSEFAGAQDILIHELGVHSYLYKPQTSLKKLARAVVEATPVAA